MKKGFSTYVDNFKKSIYFQLFKKKIMSINCI